MRALYNRILLAAALSLLCAGVASAEPFVIASGGGTVDASGIGRFVFANADGSIRLDLTGSPTSGNPVNRCRGGCSPGQTVTLGLALTGFDVFGTATVRGVGYAILNAGGLATTFTQVTLPTTLVSGGVSFSQNFTLTGRFDFRERFGANAPVLDITGTGQELARFVADPALGTYRPVDAFYGTPSLIPEPATIVLLGTGLAGVWAKRRRRR